MIYKLLVKSAFCIMKGTFADGLFTTNRLFYFFENHSASTPHFMSRKYSYNAFAIVLPKA